MQFPSPSETFASHDVVALKKIGMDISVFSMRSQHVLHDKMLKERALEDIPLCASNSKKVLAGVIEIFKSSCLFLSTLKWILLNDIKKPQHCIRLIALMPISFYILKQLKKLQPDVVHLFWGHYPSVVGFLLKKRLPHVKLSMFLGAYDLEYALGVSRSLAQKADWIFTHAYANEKSLRHLGIEEDKIHVVHRGTCAKEHLKILEGIKKENHLWIVAGRLIPLKRFEMAIDIFGDFSKNIDNSKMLVCGDGELKEVLKTQVTMMRLENRVEFKGHISQHLLLQYMAKSDVLLLLSSRERLPNVVKEAMLVGCICIVSDTPGIHELIEDGKTGFIIKNGQYDSIPQLVMSLTQTKKEQMREEAKKFILENFDVEDLMKKYVQIWRQS